MATFVDFIGTAVGTGAFDAQEPMMRIARGNARYLIAKPHFFGKATAAARHLNQPAYGITAAESPY